MFDKEKTEQIQVDYDYEQMTDWAELQAEIDEAILWEL